MLRLDVRAHRPAVLANTDYPQKLFAALRLSADREKLGAGDSSLVAVAIAVDTSGSMYSRLPGGASKIDRAIAALSSFAEHHLVDVSTRLSIVQFDHNASIILPLSRIEAEGLEALKTEISRLRNFGGGTNLALALEKVYQQLSQAPPDVVKKAIILTDGETTDEADCLRLAQGMARAGVSLHCVGLGADYNEDFLARLSDETNGFLYHLSEREESLDELGRLLEGALQKSQRELITNVRAGFALAPGTALTGFSRVVPMVQTIPHSRAPSGDRIWHVGNVNTVEDVVLLAELDVPPRPEGSFPICDLQLSFDVPAIAPGPRAVLGRVSVNYTADAAEAGELDEDVLFYVRQARVNALADQAVSFTRQGRLQDARNSILAVQQLSLKVGNRAMSRAAEAAAIELTSRKTLQADTAKRMKVGAKTMTILTPPTKQDPFA